MCRIGPQVPRMDRAGRSRAVDSEVRACPYGHWPDECSCREAHWRIAGQSETPLVVVLEDCFGHRWDRLRKSSFFGPLARTHRPHSIAYCSIHTRAAEEQDMCVCVLRHHRERFHDFAPEGARATSRQLHTFLGAQGRARARLRLPRRWLSPWPPFAGWPWRHAQRRRAELCGRWRTPAPCSGQDPPRSQRGCAPSRPGRSRGTSASRRSRRPTRTR